jgi:hypothetical protein
MSLDYLLRASSNMGSTASFWAVRLTAGGTEDQTGASKHIAVESCHSQCAWEIPNYSNCICLKC